MSNSESLCPRMARAWRCLALLLLVLLSPVDARAGLFEKTDLETLFAGGTGVSRLVEHRANLWRELFDALNLPSTGTVVEIQPGKSADIALGLALVGFRGTLYLAGNEAAWLGETAARYRGILPMARIEPVIGTGETGWGKLPTGPDLLVTNQLGKAGTIDGNPTAMDWALILETLDPRCVIATRNEDESANEEESVASVGGAEPVDSAVKTLLERLRSPGRTSRVVEQMVQAAGYDPSQWLIERRRGLEEFDVGRMVPGAVERIGSATFVTMDAWPLSQASAAVLFLSDDLLKLMTGRGADGRAFVERNLLLSLDPKDAQPGVPPIKVYVDRQADPMNMSLTGNLGSGRAAYAGDRFNLKGIGKTVLATSKDPLHSNGAVDMVSAIWEMLCANALQAQVRTGTSPVLTVIDTRKKVAVDWVDQKVPGGIIVRLTDHGELDRPTHLFHRDRPVTPDQLRYMARRFGMQDAEKIIERILHGGWSAGNISIHGHLIDYETVFAVRNRAPQWSYRPNWLSDFFGLEALGQKELLSALAKHPINAGKVPPAELRRIFDKARRTRLERRFPDLLGINPREFAVHLPVFIRRVSSLVTQFERLSMKMFPHFAATSPWDKDNAGLAVYDMSRFFRFYPILRRAGPVDEAAALRLLKNPVGKNLWSVELEEYGMPADIEQALLKEFVVSSPEQLAKLDLEALAFIREFEAFLNDWWQVVPGSIAAMCRQAYVVNEERTYLNSRPGNDTLIALVEWYGDGRLSPEGFSGILHLILEASDRLPRFDARGRCQADMKLYQNACLSNLVLPDGSSYQPRLTLLGVPGLSEDGAAVLNTLTDSHGKAESAWQVEIDGATFPCTIEREPGRLHIVGPSLPLARLIDAVGEPLFSRGGHPFRVKPILRKRQEPVYYR